MKQNLKKIVLLTCLLSLTSLSSNVQVTHHVEAPIKNAFIGNENSLPYGYDRLVPYFEKTNVYNMAYNNDFTEDADYINMHFRYDLNRACIVESGNLDIPYVEEEFGYGWLILKVDGYKDDSILFALDTDYEDATIVVLDNEFTPRVPESLIFPTETSFARYYPVRNGDYIFVDVGQSGDIYQSNDETKGLWLKMASGASVGLSKVTWQDMYWDITFQGYASCEWFYYPELEIPTTSYPTISLGEIEYPLELYVPYYDYSPITYAEVINLFDTNIGAKITSKGIEKLSIGNYSNYVYAKYGEDLNRTKVNFKVRDSIDAFLAFGIRDKEELTIDCGFSERDIAPSILVNPQTLLGREDVQSLLAYGMSSAFDYYKKHGYTYTLTGVAIDNYLQNSGANGTYYCTYSYTNYFVLNGEYVEMTERGYFRIISTDRVPYKTRPLSLKEKMDKWWDSLAENVKNFFIDLFNNFVSWLRSVIGI